MSYCHYELQCQNYDIIWIQVFADIRRDLFYLLDYVTRRSEKLRFVTKKMVQRQIGNRFSVIGILFAPLKKINVVN